MEQSMHQTQMTMPQHHQTTTALHPNAAMHMSTGTAATGPTVPTGPQTHHHFLSSPALASPSGSTNNPTHSANPPIAANAPCSTLFVANLGQFVSEHELKEVFSSMPGFCRLRMHTKGSHSITPSTSSTNSSTAITKTTTSTTNSTNTMSSTIAFNTSNANQAINCHQQQSLSTSSNGNNNNQTCNPVAFIEFKDAVSAATAMQQLQGKYLLSSDRGSIRIEFAKTKMNNDATPMSIVGHHNQPKEHLNNNIAMPIKTTVAPAQLIATNIAPTAISIPTMTIINQPQPQLIVLNNGYHQQLAQQHPHHHQHHQTYQQQQQQSAHQHFFAGSAALTPTGATTATLSSLAPSPSHSSLAAIFNNNNNSCTTASTNTTNSNINLNVNANYNHQNENRINNINNNNNIVSHSSAQPPPPTVVVNSLQHQNHLFRDRSGYGIKA